MHGVEISATLVSQVTQAAQEDISLWQNRPLDEGYPIVFLDAIRVKVRHDNRSINKAIYLAIGVSLDGLKGFPEAIEAVFPQTQTQFCPVHMVRHSLG